MEVPAKRDFIREKVVLPVLSFLKTGSSPEQLAIAFSLGAIVGIIPLLGTSTLICTLLAFALRLNLAALQLVNYLIFPLQLLFFIPFFQVGGFLFEPMAIPLSFTQLNDMLSTDLWGTLQQFWFANLQALLVWFILSIPTYFLLYFLFLLPLKKLSSAILQKKDRDS